MHLIPIIVLCAALSPAGDTRKTNADAAAANEATAHPSISDRAERERAAEPLYRAALAEATRPDADTARVLDSIETALRAGACPTRTLTEECMDRYRTEPRFRELIRTYAHQSDTCIIAGNEPGERIQVRGIVLDGSGNAVEGALVYIFQTDSRGEYAHGNMDEDNPRLFGYLRTAVDGRFSFATIRPAPYNIPRVRVEQHIHMMVTTEAVPDFVWRVGFADDPHWAKHEKPLPRWVAELKKDDDGESFCEITIPVRPRP